MIRCFLMFLLINTEPISTQYESNGPGTGGEYTAFWYAVVIGPDVICEENTGMADKKLFQTHLVSFEDAVEKQGESTPDGSLQACIVRKAVELWLEMDIMSKSNTRNIQLGSSKSACQIVECSEGIELSFHYLSPVAPSVQEGDLFA
ncbi:hypothetical protein K439DRAFT_700563 [Ramaria rubella]|nr:hypothetical protein K439DRAFT_700563 [Ramaria rubella]